MRVKYLFLVIALIGASFLSAINAMPPADVLGSWKYTVSNVPPEYESGVMTFEKKDGKIVGYLGQNERLEMMDLSVNDDKIAFKLDFQGQTLSVNLAKSGDKLEGAVVTQDGELPISAVRETK